MFSKDFMNSEKVSLKEIAQELELSEFRVRKAHRDGELETFKEVINEGGTKKVYATPQSVVEWRSNIKNVRRDDGRGKYTIYLTKEEEARLETILDQVYDESFDELFFRTNKK